MRTRLKDVAEKLNLSPALISGVLNGRSNLWASEETRARIFAAAKELNYQPSMSAKALSKGKTDTVALVYRRLEGLEFRLAYTGLVDAFSAYLQGNGYDLTVSNFATQAEVLEQLRTLAASRSCDAVILWGREEDTLAQGELLESLNVPFLVKGRHELTHPHWRQVDFDHEWMTANATESLVNLGHTRLAYLGFAHPDDFVVSLRRGFTDAHRRLLGTDPDPRFFAEVDDAVEPNEAKILEWLDLREDERPTGFVVAAGNFAWLALETSLAHIGGVLTQNPGGYSAAGTASHFFTLMFGEAVAYQGIEIDNLAVQAAPLLLKSVLLNEPREPIIRIRPPLAPAPSLHLLDHGVTFAHAKPISHSTSARTGNSDPKSQ